MKRSAPLAVVLALQTLASTALAVDLPIPRRGTLVIPAPLSWSVERDGSVGANLSWKLIPPDAGGGIILVTVIPTSPGALAVRAAIREVASRVGAQTGEEELRLWERQGPDARIVWFTHTDPKATNSADDYSHRLSALVDLETLWLLVSVLHHGPDPELEEAAVVVLAGSRLVPTPLHQGDARLRLPGRAWSLVLPLDGFEVEAPTLNDDGTGVTLSAEHPETGLIVSAFIERTGKRWPATRWRDWYLRRSRANPIEYESVREGEIGGHAVLQYHLTTLGDVVVDQRNLNAFLVHDGTWIDVHLSKTEFRPEEAELFRALIEGLRIEVDGEHASGPE